MRLFFYLLGGGVGVFVHEFGHLRGISYLSHDFANIFL